MTVRSTPLTSRTRIRSFIADPLGLLLPDASRQDGLPSERGSVLPVTSSGLTSARKLNQGFTAMVSSVLPSKDTSRAYGRILSRNGIQLVIVSDGKFWNHVGSLCLRVLSPEWRCNDCVPGMPSLTEQCCVRVQAVLLSARAETRSSAAMRKAPRLSG